ncbi:MAG: recombinase family protein [Colwellia sp.]|nr:recombinase family protein [Colwellia sp.]
MTKVIAYIRISDKNKQNAESQTQALIQYAEGNKLLISEYVTEEVSGSKTSIEDRKLSKLSGQGHTILMTDITRVGRKKVFDLLGTVGALIKNGGELHLTNTNRIINDSNVDDAETIFTVVGGSFAAVEESKLRSQRAINGHKNSNLKSGRSHGAVVKSKLDEHVALISSELSKGTAKSKIIRMIEDLGTKITRKGFYLYCDKRGLLTK